MPETSEMDPFVSGVGVFFCANPITVVVFCPLLNLLALFSTSRFCSHKISFLSGKDVLFLLQEKSKQAIVSPRGPNNFVPMPLQGICRRSHLLHLAANGPVFYVDLFWRL